MCVLYRVFLLYHMPYCSFYVVYVLPIQLLRCHSSNKRLSLHAPDHESHMGIGRSALAVPCLPLCPFIFECPNSLSFKVLDCVVAA